MFLDTLRKKKLILCSHADDSFHVQFTKDGDRLLICRGCDYALSLRHYFCQYLCKEESFGQAAEYVDWIGDYTLPCYLKTHLLRNRAPTTFTKTQYDTVFKASLLLQMLHSPFERQEDSEEPTPEGRRFLRETIHEGLDHLIRQFPSDSLESVDAVVRHALILLRNMFDVESKRYFEVVVPYVKSSLKQPTGQSPSIDVVNPLSDRSFFLERAIKRRLIESYLLQCGSLGLCASFDAVHVAALCFLCRADLELVSNLVLDFAGKVCRGYYNEGDPNPLERQVQQVLADVLPRLNVRMSRHLKVLRAGGRQLEESLSSEFFKTYWILKATVLEKKDDWPPAHCEWVFPRMLFTNYVDYCAFSAALAHYTVEMKLKSVPMHDMVTRRAPPRVILECRTLFRFVTSSLCKVKAFDDCFVEARLQQHQRDTGCDDLTMSEEEVDMKDNYYWTRDMLKRFFEMDPKFKEDLMNAIKWWAQLPLHRTDEPNLSREPSEVGLKKEAQRDPRDEISPDTFRSDMAQPDLYQDLWGRFMKRKKPESEKNPE